MDYLGHDYLPDQPEHRRITARMALTHRTGFVNWRAGYDDMGGPLPLPFPPGSEYTYSGEGMLFLQRAIEAITGEPLDRLAQERLFAPLGLVRTSFVWTEALERDLASGHREDGSFKDRTRYRRPNAAYSLYTTPGEYARLMLTLQHPELLGDRALTKATVDRMLQRELRVDDENADRAARPRAVRRDLPRARLEPRRHAGRRHRRALRVEQLRLQVLRPVQPGQGLGPRDLRQRRGRLPPARGGHRAGRGPLRPTPPAGTTRSPGR